MLYQPETIVLLWLLPVVVFCLIPLAFCGICTLLSSLRALAGKQSEVQPIPIMEPLEA